MNTPAVSIFIPCYNYAHYVGQAIESVLSQTNSDLELIVIDNGSTDDSWRVIQSYKDPRIKTFRIEKNEGVGKAWAMGLSHSTGEWFGLLPADDYLVSDKHERLLRYLEAHPEVDAIGGYCKQVDENGQPWVGHAWMESIINEPRDFNILESWMMRHYLCIPTALYRRRLCSLPSADDINACSDYNFHLRLLRNGCRFAQLPEVMSFYRWHTTNTSMNEQSTAAQQFAYCYAKHFLPFLRESGQIDQAGVAITRFFDLYYLQIRAASPHGLGQILLSMFWPEWVEENCPDYNALLALDWENRQDGHHFHALRAMVNASFLKWTQVDKPSPAKPKRRQKNGALRDAGRKLERGIRRLIRGK